MKANKCIFGWVAALALLGACREDDRGHGKTGEVTTYKVAVVMPAAGQEHWERVADWALENIREAQEGLPQAVRLELEWKDEAAADWEDYLQRVAKDGTYAAVVGPYSSAKAYAAAEILGESGKPLVLPIATSTEFQRVFAGAGNVWNLVQSDITQCEILLTQAVLSEYSEVCLLTSDDDYGRSFSDWFAYQAVELGLQVGEVFIYRSEAELREAVRENGQREWIRPYQNERFMEDVTSIAMLRMVEKSPVVGYVTGQRERSMYGDFPYDMGFLMSSKASPSAMCNIGFDVREVTLDERISDDVKILWLSDPRDAFTPEEEDVLREYIDRGGNLVFMGEYLHRDVQNQFLNKYFGVELTPLIVGPDVRFKGTLPRMDLIAAMPTEIAKKKMRQIKGTYTIAHEGAAGVEQVADRGFEMFPVVACDTMSTYWTEVETTDFVDDTAKFNPQAGEISKFFNTVVGLEREHNGRTQKIMVSGDMNCLTNGEFTITRSVAASNGLLMLGCANWMTDGKLPLDMRRPEFTDRVIHLDMGGFSYLQFFILWFLPIAVAGLGVFLYFKRRGR